MMLMVMRMMLMVMMMVDVMMAVVVLQGDLCGYNSWYHAYLPPGCGDQVGYGPWHVLGNIIMCIFTFELVLKLVRVRSRLIHFLTRNLFFLCLGVTLHEEALTHLNTRRLIPGD